MKIRLSVLGLFLLVGSILQAQAPRVIYSEPEKEDSRRTNFEILGKLGNNFLIYKKIISNESWLLLNN